MRVVRSPGARSILARAAAGTPARWHHPDFSGNSSLTLISLHAAVALFGFAGLFGKWIAWDPTAIVLGRTCVAAAVLALFMRWRKVGLPRPTVALVLNGVLLALHWVAFFAAIQVSTVAVGLLGFASFPLFVLLLERWLLGRRWRSADAAITMLVVLGLMLVVPDWSWTSTTLHGLAWGIVAGSSFALLAVRMRALRASQSATAIALWQNAFAGLALLPLVVLAGGVGGQVTVETILLIVLLGAVCTALAHSLFIASLARVSAHTAGAVAALEPAYGIALGWALLGEVPAARTWLGAGLLVAAAIVASWRARPGA